MGKRFSKIHVEITNLCNLACSFCSRDKRKKREMSVEEFQEIIEKIKDYTNNVYLHVKGEPLLHSHLDEILSICDKNKINVRITTNGTLLKDKKKILLKHRIKQINISLHSENNLPTYFRDVFKVSDELSKKTTVIYRIWVDKLSTRIVDKINDYYQLDNDTYNKIKEEKNVKIKDNIYIDKDYEFIWPQITDKKSDFGTCLGTKSHIAILSDGNVTICCLDSDGIVKLGNIFDNNLEDILDSKLFKEINNGFKNNKIVCDLCKSCTYRYRFNEKGKK